MSGQVYRNKINIGVSSLILIFIVVCMASFGLLSLSSAQGDLKLARRNALAVTGYYEADNKGQEWLRDVDRILIEEAGKGQDPIRYSQELEKRMGSSYDSKTGLITTDIPMDKGQSLHIELALVGGEERYEIKAWYVYNTQDYGIDDSMPVWDGQTQAQRSKK